MVDDLKLAAHDLLVNIRVEPFIVAPLVGLG